MSSIAVGYVRVHPTPYKMKPKGSVVGSIQKAFPHLDSKALTLGELMQTTTQGHTVKVGDFDPEKYNEKGNITGESYLPGSTRAMFLDVDNKEDSTKPIPPEEIITRLSECGIKVAHCYHSFSYTPEHPRYRLVVVREEPFYDAADYTAFYSILDGLTTQLFGHQVLDPGAKDISRLWFGGTPCSEQAQALLEVGTTSIEQALNALVHHTPCSSTQEARAGRNIRGKYPLGTYTVNEGYQSTYWGGTYVEKRATLYITYRIAQNSSPTYWGGTYVEKRATLYITYRIAHFSTSTGKPSGRENIPNKTTSSEHPTTSRAEYEVLREVNPMKHSWVAQFYERCHDATLPRPTYSEVMTAGTNFQHIKGHKNTIKKWLDDRVLVAGQAGVMEEYDSKYRLLRAIRRGDLPNPMTWSETDRNGPGGGDCGYSLYSDLKRTGMISIGGVDVITLEQAEMNMMMDWDKALTQGADDQVAILQYPTGIGKSRLLESLSEKFTPGEYGKLVIAAPTHALKDEMAGRLRAVGLPVITTPQLPDGAAMGTKNKTRIEHLYAVGAGRLVRNELARLSFTVPEIARYLGAMNDARYNTDSILITTHQQALYMKQDGSGFGTFCFSSREVFIWDEDPLTTCIKTRTVSLKELQQFAGALISSGTTDALKDLVNDAIEVVQGARNTPVNTNEQYLPTEPDIDKVAHIAAEGDYTGDILSFITSSHYVALRDYTDENKGGIGLCYSTIKSLPKNRFSGFRHIILSATANQLLWKQFVGWDNDTEFNYYGGAHVRTVGEVVMLDSPHSYSRTSMRNPTVYNRAVLVRDELGVSPDNVITFMGSKNMEGQPPLSTAPIHFGNCSGYDNWKGQNILVVGLPYPNQVATLLIATELGLFNIRGPVVLILADDVIERGGWKFKLKTYTNDLMREVQLWSIESNLVQAVGRGRALREDCTVHILCGYPLPTAKLAKVDDVIKATTTDPFNPGSQW